MSLSPAARAQVLRDAVAIFSDDELREAIVQDGALAAAATDELAERTRALESATNPPETPFDPQTLLRDALGLRMALQQMYAAGDGGARQEPRYRRAGGLIERTEYLIGPDSPCTGNPRCSCPAHQAYEQWLADDARREQASLAAEQAREAQPGAIRRVM